MILQTIIEIINLYKVNTGNIPKVIIINYNEYISLISELDNKSLFKDQEIGQSTVISDVLISYEK